MYPTSGPSTIRKTLSFSNNHLLFCLKIKDEWTNIHDAEHFSCFIAGFPADRSSLSQQRLFSGKILAPSEGANS